MEIYVSGLYSGPNPSPGVGIARSLRIAYPNASIIGVDYSSRSTGIHWPDFDRIMLQRSWAELDLTHYASTVQALISSGATWISGLDLEVFWLAKELPGCPGLLSPPLEGVLATRKPDIRAHRDLALLIAPYISIQEPSSAVNAFCRRHGWRVWIKGPYYEACRVRTWQELWSFESVVRETWSTEDLFLQAHVSGDEESMAFVAYRGELLQCIWMRKKDITAEGKTWAGEVSLPPGEMVDLIQGVVRDLNWTGGAELEFIRDVKGQLWLMEWNPRFPAWIFGGTIAGYNLPAELIKKSYQIEPSPMSGTSSEFVRVVLEVPTRSEFPLLEPALRADMFSFTQKHPSGMPLLAKRLQDNLMPKQVDSKHKRKSAEIPAAVLEDLDGAPLQELETPCCVFLPTVAGALMRDIAQLSARLSIDKLRAIVAYSIKTNPNERILKLVESHGFMVEAISADEFSTALKLGFGPSRVVLNGPAKAWPRTISERVFASFCDSFEELESSARHAQEGRAQSRILGIRIKPPKVFSRFGILIESPTQFARLARIIRQVPGDVDIGVHFHIASSAFGIPFWWDVLDSAISWAIALENATQRRIDCLDFGGGWFAEDLLQEQTQLRLHNAIQGAVCALQGLSHVIIEPGKALSQSACAVLVRVLEVRRLDGSINEIVVDGSISEINQVQLYPHIALRYDSKREAWHSFERGGSRILGRLCMENDILADNVEIPKDIKVGEFVAFCDSGAYDRSMAYTFGRGA